MASIHPETELENLAFAHFELSGWPTLSDDGTAPPSGPAASLVMKFTSHCNEKSIGDFLETFDSILNMALTGDKELRKVATPITMLFEVSELPINAIFHLNLLREFLKTHEATITRTVVASAIVTKSTAVHTVLKALFSMYKPKRDTKVFADIEEAKAYLRAKDVVHDGGAIPFVFRPET